MLLTSDRLRTLANALDTARAQSTEMRHFWCVVQRKDAARDPSGRVLAAPHGRAFLGIDPDTGAIACTRCAEGVDSE